MKALVIETAFLGDAILSVALAEALKQIDPDARITYLVRPESAALLSYAPAVDEVVTFDKYGAEAGLKAIDDKAAELNVRQFDVVFCLHESQRTGLLVSKLTAKRKIGFGNFSSLTDKVLHIPGAQRTARAVSLLKAMYDKADLTALPKLDVSGAPVPKELTVTSPFVAIAPGSVWKTKRWPAQYFAVTADRLAASGYMPVFIGSSQDREAMDEVRSVLTTDHLDLVGKTSIVEAAAVISGAKFLLANDSAPVHIATALGIPSGVIFGPTVAQFGFAPPSPLGVVIENASLWCRPCTSHGSNECPIHTHECMTTISPAAVLNSLAGFMEFNRS